jgi:hypothetical protein
MVEKQPGLLDEARKTVKREIDEAGLTQIDYVKEALSWQYNWIGLLGAAAFALVSGSGLHLVLAAGVELVYVSLVPQSSRFRRLVRSWKYAQQKREHLRRFNQLYDDLPTQQKNRYAAVDTICAQIRENLAQLSSTSQIFVSQMQEKLDGLLQGYVRLLDAGQSQREHVRQTNSNEIEREIDQLQKTMGRESSKVQEINRKRIEILKKRVEKFEKIRENLEVIDAQCFAIEDVLQLIRDQSVTMRDPQQVSDQLESLMVDVEHTEQTVREVEAIFSITAADGSENIDLPQRGKVRN